MKKKNLYMTIGAIVVVLFLVYVVSVSTTTLKEDSVITPFGNYKANTNYLFGFSFKKPSIIPIKIKKLALVNENREELTEDQIGKWEFLKNNDEVSIISMIKDEESPIINYDNLEDFSSEKLRGGENYVLQLQPKEDKESFENIYLKVEYSVLGITKSIFREVLN